VSEHLPPPDVTRFPATLKPGDVRILPAGTIVARIYAARVSTPTGVRETKWYDMREFGPTGSRFDTHPAGPGRIHRGHGVMYLAPAVPTAMSYPSSAPQDTLKVCCAEVYRDSGVIDTDRGDPHFATFALARDIALLDLSDSDWITRAGGNGAITSGPREPARAWAREIASAYPHLDGLWYASSNIPPARAIALWDRIPSAVPTAGPQLNRALANAGMRDLLEHVASSLRIGLV